MRTTAKLCLSLLTLFALWTLASEAAPGDRDPLKPAADIDRIINKKLKEAKLPASSTVDDAAFIRRASLDIIGRIPDAERVVAFLKDTDPDKRRKLIDELLADNEYGEHFGAIWYHQMIKKDSDNRLLVSPAFGTWLSERFNKNTPWNKTVQDVLTAEGARDKNPATIFWLAHVGPEREPEPNRVTATAMKFFLGIRLECCECHDHPFTTLKQKDFWGVAAFFNQVDSDGTRNMQVKNGTEPSITENGPVKAKGKGAAKAPAGAPSGSIVIPDTNGKTVKAKYLLGAEPPVAGKPQLRPTFATWATAPNNPFFAKAAVNRWWAHFFGRGLVSPIDDLQPSNKPSHPELLELLTKEFTSSGFDLKYLIRCICNSQAYQRSSAPRPENKQDVELYSHAAVRMMTADMLFDSLEVALSHSPAGGKNAAAKRVNKAGGGPREQFRQFFHTEADDDASAMADYAHGIPQVLRLMNSAQMNDTTTVVNRILKTESTPEKIVEALYLRILSRLPTPSETKR
ncbi:MAG: DUF1549 domain-containing protein, partial [Planctomycetia bacterium]|nr:DUF1549 domain-containing protein [Planctomycetia bacterium]